jgi:hypothetical protein
MTAAVEREFFLSREELEYIGSARTTQRGRRRMFFESVGRALFGALGSLLVLLLVIGFGVMLCAAFIHLVLGMKAVKLSPETGAAVQTCLYWGIAIYFGGALALGLRRYGRTARLYTEPDYADWGPRAVVTFASPAFNMTETKDYYLNPGCFGDDVALWFIEEMSKRGYPVASNPGREDFGWYVLFGEGPSPHCLVISHLLDDSDRFLWFCEVERQFGFWRSLMGRRAHYVDEHAVAFVHEVLSQSTLIDELRWHYPDICIPGLTGKETPM